MYEFEMFLAHNLAEKERSKDVILSENVNFETLILPLEISKGLSDCGFEKPSPIQLKALPLGRCGFDIIVKSKSGTGKTLVFTVIALESLKVDKFGPQVLILAPTREIAVQIQQVVQSVGKHYQGLSVECFIGGLPVSTDKQNCKSCHIVVGTPGRIKQLTQEKALVLDQVKLFVLDEADKLIEQSYENDINFIYNHLPDKKQILMCSATYPDEMKQSLEQYMCNPMLISAEIDSPLLLGLKHYARLLKSSPNIVQQTKVKNDEIVKLLSAIPFSQCLIFSNYQTRAESICNFLNRNGWSSTYISAAQTQTERLNSLAGLKECRSKILITTDLTARGIDSPNVDLVVNYDIPVDATTYLHRMGRAGRYGSTGNCVNLCFLGQEEQQLKRILGCIGGQNLTMPVVEGIYNLDSAKEKCLKGECGDFNGDFKKYTSEISQIRHTVAEQQKNKVQKNKGKSKTKTETVKDSDILRQLASGTFDFAQPEVAKPKPDTMDLLQQLAACGEVSSHETFFVQPEVPKPKPDTMDLLQQLATCGEVASHAKSDKSDILCKNKALLSVAKILSSDTTQEDCKEITDYVNSLKSEAATDCVTTAQTENFEELFDNILTLGYRSQIDSNAPKWQDLLPISEKHYLSKIELDDNDEDYNFEPEKEIQITYSQNYTAPAQPDEFSYLKWVPVEPRSEPVYNQEVSLPVKRSKPNPRGVSSQCEQTFGKYFQHCSTNLWQCGLSFPNADSFDYWFCNDWERQLDSVRNFVQNKIYLEEMSRLE